MEDVQSGQSEIPLDIDRVGVKALKLPLTVRQRATGVQHTVATVDMSVDLPAAGTHMSRFVEALENWSEELYSVMWQIGFVSSKLSEEGAHTRARFAGFL